MSDHQREPVDEAARGRAARDLDRSFCVEAGAGTGKTRLLVERFLSIVASGRAKAPEIVALTFTEKAAGEMKIRIRREIERRLAERNRSEDERRLLAGALEDLERSPISTIHSFAASILREYPIEAGVDPGFAQLDGLEGSLFFDECWGDFLLEGAPAWQEAMRRFVALGGSIEMLAAMGRALYERRGERSCAGIFGSRLFARPPVGNGASPGHAGGAPNGTGSAHGYAGAGSQEKAGRESPPADDALKPGRDGDKTVEAFREEIVRLARMLSVLAREHCANAEDRGYAAIEQLLREAETFPALRGEGLERALLSLAIPKPKGNKANWSPPETCADQKRIFEELARLQAQARRRISDGIAAALGRLFEAFLSFADDRKAAAGVLDFDDLLIRVRRLCARSEALDALRRRYRFILVDEFQDTDPVQAEIIYLLSCRSGVGACDAHADEADGSAPVRGAGVLELEPGKLFIVGDPKQSIYRFRKADVEIYELVKEALVEGGGERVSIVQNFRSVPGIVRWVNETFSAVMQPPAEGRYQPRYEDIEPFRAGDGSPVIAFDLEMEEADPASAAIRRREGEAVARIIHHLVSSRMSVMDPATRRMERLAYRHIAVIYPGTTGIDNYEEPLRAENIPYIIEGGKLYYTREEIRALAAAIWAIEDPYDPLALLAALRSPLFGASDEEIFLFARAGGRLEYLDPGHAALEEFPGLADAFDLFRGLHFSRNETGPAEIIIELLRRTEFLELSLLRPHGDQRVANIRKAVAGARSFAGGAGSYRRFARWFRDQEVLASEESESPMIEEDENAVRMLTMHKAKGLQFPVVILANLVQTRRAGSRLIVGPEGRLAFKIGDSLETGDYAELAEREFARDKAETIRLLYVAATRAGDLLVVPRPPKSGGYFDIVGWNLERESWRLSDMPMLRGKARPFVRLDVPSSEERARSDRMRDEWERGRRALIERAKHPVTAVAPSRLVLDAVPGDSRAGGPGAGGPSPRGAKEGALFGEAFHRIMELAAAGARDLPRIAAAVAAELGMEAEAPSLARLAGEALASEIMRRAARATRRLSEVPFIVSFDGGFVQGRIDLLFEEKGRWTVVDYKTDDVDAVEIAERIASYRPQAAAYALALDKLGIQSSGEIVFLFARPAVARSIAVTPRLLEEAEERIRAALARDSF